jgi:hypothetical protein
MSTPQKPAAIITTKEFDFSLFHNSLKESKELDNILNLNLDLTINCNPIDDLLKVDYSKYSRIYIFRDDPSFKTLILNSNFVEGNVLTVL